MATPNTNQARTLPLSDLPDTLATLAAMPTRYPPSVVLMGDPGIGKTAAVQSYANSIDATLVTRTGSEIADPSEVAGMSVPEGRVMRRLLPEMVSRCWSAYLGQEINGLFNQSPDTDTLLDIMLSSQSDDATKHEIILALGITVTLTPVILFIDELTKAPPSIQAFCLTLMNEHQVSGFGLPPKTQVICAANGTSDGSACYELPSTILNRCFIFNTTPDVQSWIEYESSRPYGLHDGLKAHIEASGLESLNRGWDSKEPQEPYPTPRSWSAINALLSTFKPNSLQSKKPPLALVAALIGSREANRLLASLADGSKLLSYTFIIENALTAAVPTSTALQTRTAEMLANKLTSNVEFNHALEYCKRLSGNSFATFIQTAASKHPQFCPNPVKLMQEHAQTLKEKT